MAYSMVAQFPAVVEKVVIVSAAVCMEERDIVEGRFNVPSLEVAAELLLPQTPEKLKELMNMTLTKPPKFVPNCFLYDFIQVSYACSVFLGSITLFFYFVLVQNLFHMFSTNLSLICLIMSWEFGSK